MTYSSGGLIQAADFSAISGSTSSTGANLLNTVWATGTGDAGYGQTAVTPPSASATVTANLGGGAGVSAGEWAGLINRLNNASTHQSGSATAVSPPTAGSTIAYIAALTGAVTTVYTNRLNFNSTQGTTSTTSYNFSYSGAIGVGLNVTATQTRTCTFSSVDAARYFFNAGGQIKVTITSVTNNDGTDRSANQVTLWATNLGSKTMRARSSLARTGTGGTVDTDLTTSGFWNLTTSYVTFTKITTTNATYSTDYVQLAYLTNGTAGSYAGNGSVVTIQLTGYSAQDPGFNGTVNVTVNYDIAITYPETTYLANSWGTVTVA